MKVGIIGLPQSGKTTLFNALTGAHGEVGGFHDEDRVDLAVLKVPDERLRFLEELFQPERVVPATIQFEDIAGGFSQSGAGKGKSARALGAMRATDALLVVLRCFEDAAVPHPRGGVDPGGDLRAIRDELLLSDLDVVEKRMTNIERDLKKPGRARDALRDELELLERCQKVLEDGSGLGALELNEVEEKMLRSYGFLTQKPCLYVLNVGEDRLGEAPEVPELEGVEPEPIAMSGELEMEIMDLDEEDRKVFMEDLGIAELACGRVVRACYDAMGLRSFFTFAGSEVRAWTVKAGESAVAAAGKIHSDMAEGFIRAEVVAFDDLQECGSLQDARSGGKVRLEGKGYEVQDGDVITFRFSS